MDHYSILDHSSPPAAGLAVGADASAAGSSSISAKIAAANTLLPSPSEAVPRFPAEDAGRSLAEMAHRDLDAALQLLAERAQYITGASGTAIALRRGEHNDMVCRAAAGSSAPDLGALLSMEHGLSGECVRTRQLLRCDDAERDPRVNREVCRELGIASVIVMPIVGDEQVLGIFELLSGKPRAFDERDLSALLRLSEMVEAAVRHALPAQIAPQVREVIVAESQPPVEKVVEEEAKTPQPEAITAAAVSPDPAAPVLVPPVVVPIEAQPAKEIKEIDEPPAAKKALFWSAALRAQSGEPPKQNAEASAVPPVLRNFQKCQACGFPVSQGRTFCVECEEKQWRGQRMAQATASQVPVPQQSNQLQSTLLKQSIPDKNAQEVPVQNSQPDQLSMPLVVESEPATPVPKSEVSEVPQELEPVALAVVEVAATPQTLGATSSPSSSNGGANAPADALSSNEAALFLNSTLQSESWFASNKYVLATLLVVGIVIGAIAWLR
ncbi:MAG: GAF domain-containing protein [Candidatus Sulfotelmatobacter sp.]